jgi:hypothetical protein
MRIKQMLLPGVLLSLAAMTAGAAEEETRPTGTWEDYRLIIQRNVFDPERRKPVVEQPKPEETPRPVVDEILLVGTLLTDRETYAFFEGSQPDYRTVQTLRSTIADGTITEIAGDRISLVIQGVSLQLPVGNKLIRENQGEWKISTDATLTAASARNVVLESSGTDDREPRSESAPTEAESSESDLLKQLREKRQRELGQ